MRISDWSSTCALPISALQQSGPERPRVRHVPPGHRHAETRDWPSFQVRATLLPEPSAIWAWWRHDRDKDDRTRWGYEFIAKQDRISQKSLTSLTTPTAFALALHAQIFPEKSRKE